MPQLQDFSRAEIAKLRTALLDIATRNKFPRFKQSARGGEPTRDADERAKMTAWIGSGGRGAWLFLIIYGPFPFLAFHTFVGSFYVYPSAPEVSIFLFLPFALLSSSVIMRYLPKGLLLERALASRPRWRRSIMKERKILSVYGIPEAAFWYAIVGAIYYWLLDLVPLVPHEGMDGLWPVAKAYLVYFVAVVVWTISSAVIWYSLSALLPKRAHIAMLFRGLASVAALYVAAVLFFAALFRLVSIKSATSFNAPIESSVDAIYFSTITMATVGYGDFYPKSNLAKIFVVTEVMLGTFLFAVLVGLAVNRASSVEKPRKMGVFFKKRLKGGKHRGG